MGQMVVETWGEGTRVVLVHGSLATGPMEWDGQRPLADLGYELVVPTRRAYVSGTEGEDFLTDGDDVAELLGDGAHLVGHSYGALVALVAARLRPDAVRSLVLAEPPLFDVAADDPHVAKMQSQLRGVLTEESADRDFLERFLRAVGTPVDELGEAVLDQLSTLVHPLRRARQPWDSPVPFSDLATAPFRAVVVSGDHNPAFSAVCDALARHSGARPAVVSGASHEVQAVAGDFNALLLDHWRESDAARCDG